MKKHKLCISIYYYYNHIYIVKLKGMATTRKYRFKNVEVNVQY